MRTILFLISFIAIFSCVKSKLFIVYIIWEFLLSLIVSSAECEDYEDCVDPPECKDAAAVFSIREKYVQF